MNSTTNTQLDVIPCAAFAGAYRGMTCMARRLIKVALGGLAGLSPLYGAPLFAHIRSASQRDTNCYSVHIVHDHTDIRDGRDLELECGCHDDDRHILVDGYTHTAVRPYLYVGLWRWVLYSEGYSSFRRFDDRRVGGIIRGTHPAARPPRRLLGGDRTNA